VTVHRCCSTAANNLSRAYDDCTWSCHASVLLLPAFRASLARVDTYPGCSTDLTPASYQLQLIGQHWMQLLSMLEAACLIIKFKIYVGAQI
jgi:hypothetical protein